MGLALEVGILADLKDANEEGYASYVDAFEKLRIVLRSEGLEEHVEPDEVDDIFSCDMLSYTGIHYLRRIAVHLALGKPNPAPGNRETYHNVALNEEYYEGFNVGKDMKYQHLVVHSDANGFYVPIDFKRVITTPTLRLSGGWVGSTQRLQAECAELAGLLKMPLDMDYESTRVVERCKYPTPPAQPVVAEAVALETTRDSALRRFDVEAIRRRDLCMPAPARSVRGIAAD